MMKKRFIGLVLALLLVGALAVPARADSYSGSGTVVFTAAGEMDSSFTTETLSSFFDAMEPGDDATYVITVTNRNSASVDWYMTNAVLRSLEDSDAELRSVARNGAYTYILTYRSAAGSETVLFSNDTVGGEYYSEVDQLGLHEAAAALKDYFYLDTMTTGQQGTVTLYMKLDGDTQGNSYQDTRARLRMNFAVEVLSPTGTTNRTTVVKTGDENHLLPLYIAMGVSGLLLLALAIGGVRERKKEKKEKRA